MADIAEIITEKKDLSVINIDKPQQAGSTELKNVLVLPHYSAPTGNIYDVFFWHSPKDRNWVEGLVKRLESPGFGLRCSILPIDVDHADPVTHDVRRYVESSRRTIGVFSPDYLKWFRRNTGITLQTNYDPHQRLLARIIFGQGACPEHIEILHNIEEGSELFWKQLRAAILMNDDFVDNEKIAEVPVYIGRNCCPQPTPEKGPIPKELLFRGSELGLSVEKYQEIIKIVMKTPFDGLRRHNEYMLVSFCASLAYLFQLLCLIIWFIVGLNNAAHHVTQETHSAQNINHKQTRESDVILLWCSNVLCWVQFFTCCFITYQQRIYRKMRLSLIETLAQANRIAMEHNLMVNVKQCGYKQRKEDLFTIVFTYFNWWPCLDYLQRSVSDFEKCVPLEDTKEMLSKYGSCYAMLLVERQTQSPVKRHCSHGQCVCQCIESRLPISCTRKLLTLEFRDELHFLGFRYFAAEGCHRIKSLPWFLLSRHKHDTSKRLIVITAIYLTLIFFLHFHIFNWILSLVTH